MTIPAFSVTLCGSDGDGGTGVTFSCSVRAGGVAGGVGLSWRASGKGAGKAAGAEAVKGTDTSSGYVRVPAPEVRDSIAGAAGRG